jgi:hypothetical protein
MVDVSLLENEREVDGERRREREEGRKGGREKRIHGQAVIVAAEPSAYQPFLSPKSHNRCILFAEERCSCRQRGRCMRETWQPYSGTRCKSS